MLRRFAVFVFVVSVLPSFGACASEPLTEVGAGGSASAQGGSAGAADAGRGNAGSAGSSAGSAGSGGVGANMGLPFGGSCLTSDQCTDEWDSLFGSATLALLCTKDEGVWSTLQCDRAPWAKKCTQTMADAIYVRYLPADGICEGGEEEPL